MLLFSLPFIHFVTVWVSQFEINNGLPSRALMAAALVLAVHLPILAWAFRAMPQHAHELLRLDAVLLRHVSAAEVAGDYLRLVRFAR